MQIEAFGQRLSQLREQKGVSARDMSLSIGQNAGYINNLENGRNLPSMTMFFCICRYLEIEPEDFFNSDNHYPFELNEFMEDAMKLNIQQLQHVAAIVKDIIKS